MTAFKGSELLLKKNGTVIAGLRNVTISGSGESINVTSGEDSGKRLLLAASAEEMLDISAEGISKDDLFRTVWFGGGSKMLTDITLEWPLHNAGSTPADIEGNFKITSYEEGAPYNEAATFSISLESSGDYIYTAEA